MDVSNSDVELRLRDNGGRRSSVDLGGLRIIKKKNERRVEGKRRSGLDRRSVPDRRVGKIRPPKMNRRTGLDRRSGFQV